MRHLIKKSVKNPSDNYEYEFNTGQYGSIYKKDTAGFNSPSSLEILSKETIPYAALNLDTSVKLVIDYLKERNLSDREDVYNYKLKFSEEESKIVVQQLEKLNRSIEKNFDEPIANGLKELFKKMALESVGVYYYAFYSSPQALYSANSATGLSDEYSRLKRSKGINSLSLEKARELLYELMSKCFQEKDLKLRKLLTEALGEANEELDKITRYRAEVTTFFIGDSGYYESLIPRRTIDYYSFESFIEKLTRLEIINDPDANFCSLDNYNKDGKIALDIDNLKNSPEDLVASSIYGFSLMLQDIIPRDKLLIEGVDYILESDFLNKLFNTMSYRLKILKQSVWIGLCYPCKVLFKARSTDPDLLELINYDLKDSENIPLFAIASLIVASAEGDDIISNLNNTGVPVSSQEFSAMFEGLELRRGKAALHRAKLRSANNEPT